MNTCPRCHGAILTGVTGWGGPICHCGYMPLHTTEEGEEIIKLRAEVASLKEEIYADENIRSELYGELCSVKKQLAAANGLVEKYRKGLVNIAEHYTDTDLSAKHMAAHAKAILSPTGNSMDYTTEAAISALHESDKDE